MGRFPTIQLSKVTDRMRDLIAKDEKIKQFCREKYDKDRVIFVGFDQQERIKSEDCPAIIILPQGKDEGLESQYGYYHIVIGWSIENATCNETPDGVKEFIGLHEADEFGQLIFEAIDEGFVNADVNTLNYLLYPGNWYPEFSGQMTIEIERPFYLGADHDI